MNRQKVNDININVLKNYYNLFYEFFGDRKGLLKEAINIRRNSYNNNSNFFDLFSDYFCHLAVYFSYYNNELAENEFLILASDFKKLSEKHK